MEKFEELVDAMSVISRIIFNRLKCMECNQCEPCGPEFMRALETVGMAGREVEGGGFQRGASGEFEQR